MPYIDEKTRRDLERLTAHLEHIYINSPGDLNYLVTTLINRYFATHKLNYQGINDVIGVLEGAKMEFYRRVAIPYEDGKIDENGDVYEIG